jgi:hypothetical protein
MVVTLGDAAGGGVSWLRQSVVGGGVCVIDFREKKLYLCSLSSILLSF